MSNACNHHLVPGTALGLSLALIAGPAAADPPKTTMLSNGAELSVQITSPADGTELKVPAGQPSISVDADGTAAIGEGEPDATLVYVIDESGSTGFGSGTGCSPVLDCEKRFFRNLNQAAIDDGSTDLVGVVHYETGSSIALGLTDPTSPAVATAINAASPTGLTNCAAGIANAQTLLIGPANTNGTDIVVFASDGRCNEGAPVASAVAALLAAAPDTVIHSVAIGTGSDCSSDGGRGTLSQITANGGTCHEIPDPGNTGGLIESLIGSTLEALDARLNGGAFTPIDNASVTPDLPVDGAASVVWDMSLGSLVPEDYTLEVRATGTDVLGDEQHVTDTHVFHLLQLTATPAEEDNDLNVDDTHTVSAAIIGGTGPDRDIAFVVTGTNAATASPADGTRVAEPAGPSVDFVYTVPQDCASLGQDTITVGTVIGGMEDSIEVVKNWIDETPPEVSCDPTVNPNGRNEPSAPGRGGRGRNQDGFYQLNAEDPNLANCTVTLAAVDGDGFVFAGPFTPGDNIKYTQSDEEPQEQKTMGSGQGNAGAIAWHLIGHGDLTLSATDPSGNVAETTCLVPPAPQ